MTDHTPIDTTKGATMIRYLLLLPLCACTTVIDETEPTTCEEPEAVVPLPDGCKDAPPCDDRPMMQCARQYICGTESRICITAYDCACVDALLACGSTEVPPDVCD